ncbi:MAG TPA: phage baseplate assembly protein V [Candidatus Binatia bacterium]|nr:phage baseplate assembly protein V [Candidatus Binatia bacterium]
MPVDRETLRQVGLMLRPIASRVAGSIARAVVQLVDDATKLQLLQVGALAGETLDGAEHHQPYGFTSVPLAGAEAVVVFPNGDRAHPLVVSVSDRRYRPTEGEPGQVTVYNHNGASVTLTADGDIIATPAPGREVLLGSDSASDPAALASELADLKARIAAWVPVPNDGGASLKTVFSAWPVPGATKVKVE